MKKYCEICNKEVETIIVNKKEVYNVLGENIEVDAPVLTCKECGEELFCEELDSDTLKKVYNIYRKNHKLLTAEEIKEIREMYGLSQRAFAKLLNWGDKTINRYENGSIQDKAHNSLLLFLKDPQNMKKYLNENEINLSNKQINQLKTTIDHLLNDSENHLKKDVLHSLFSKKPSYENGFKIFDYDKLCSMVIYFTSRDPKLLKTKLMKLLNYSDMLFYKENGSSISGLSYVHLPYGPVPQNHEILLGMLEHDNIAHVNIVYNGSYEYHQIVSDVDDNIESLTDAEKDVLNRVYEKFKNYGSKEISDYSHQEKGYKETENFELISYKYAKDLKEFDVL